jgi:hypothetical protein
MAARHAVEKCISSEMPNDSGELHADMASLGIPERLRHEQSVNSYSSLVTTVGWRAKPFRILGRVIAREASTECKSEICGPTETIHRGQEMIRL